MVVPFMEEKDANAVLARGLLEVGGESACTGLWIEKGGERWCFNFVSSMDISCPIVKMEKYAETVPVQVTVIGNVLTVSKSAQMAKGNIAQTITNVLFFLIVTKTDRHLYQSI